MQAWPDWKQAIYSIPAPKTHKQIREFLGAIGFCRTWIPNYSLMAKTLYEATKQREREPLEWGQEQDKSL
jgi:hypothetical protein